MNTELELRQAVALALREWRDAGAPVEEVVWAIRELAAHIALEAAHADDL